MKLKEKPAKIILISGKARAGKDTTSAYIKSYYDNQNKDVINLQYSSSLKEYAKRIIGWDGQEETKPREFLQMLGTEIIRSKIDEEFFIKRMIQDIKVYNYFYDVITISDVRVRKEIELIRKSFSNVISINIVRPNFESTLTSNQKTHLTEVDLDNYNGFDYEIINDSDLENLKNKCFEIINMIEER